LICLEKKLNPRPILVWLIALTLVVNTGFNLFFFYKISNTVYAINEDFRPDILARKVREKIEADNVKLPPVEIFKFFSADPYAKDYVMFTGEKVIVFINWGISINLSDEVLKSLLAHEIGHYVLGHLRDNRPRMFGGVEKGDLDKETEADSFAAKYEGRESTSSAIKKLVWDEEEKKTRLDALGVN